MPAHVTLAVVLGLLAGVTTGGNLTFVVLLLLAALVNVHGLTWLGAWCSGLFLVTALHNICRSVGFALLDELGLSGFVALLGDHPLLVLLDWDRYVLVGGVTLAIILAVPAAKAAHGIASARARKSIEALPPIVWLRPWASLIVPVLAILSVLFPWALMERRLADRLLHELAVLIDADVTAAETNVSIWTGQWICDDIQAVRRENKADTLFRIARLDAQVDVSELLRGRLNIQSAKLIGLDRLSAAGTSRLPLSLPHEGQQPQIQQYLQGWSQESVRLSWVSALIGALDRISSTPPLASDARPISLLNLLEHHGRLGQERSTLGHVAPRLVVRNVQIEGLSRDWGLGHKSTVELDRFSNEPATENAPTIVKVRAPEVSAEMAIALNWHKPGERHRLAVRAADLPLTEIIDPVRAAQRVIVHRGLVTIEGTGWFDQQRLYLPLSVEIGQLSAQLVGTAPLGELHPDYWTRGLRELGGLRTECSLTGPWSATQVQFDLAEVVSQFKHQLRSAGAHELLEQMERYPRGAPSVATTNVEPVPDERPVQPVAKPKAAERVIDTPVTAVTPAKTFAPSNALTISNPGHAVQISNPFVTNPASQATHDPTPIAATAPSPAVSPTPATSIGSAHPATAPREQATIAATSPISSATDVLVPPSPQRTTVPLNTMATATSSNVPPALPGKAPPPPGPINFQIGPDPSMYASRGATRPTSTAVRLPTQGAPSGSSMATIPDRTPTTTGDSSVAASTQTLSNRFSSWFGGSTPKDPAAPSASSIPATASTPAKVSPPVVTMPGTNSQVPKVAAGPKSTGERPTLSQPGSLFGSRSPSENAASVATRPAQPGNSTPPVDERPWYQRMFK